MTKLDNIKDAIDELLCIPNSLPATERRLKIKLAHARDLIEYIELHHTSQLETDIAERAAERAAERRRVKESR